MAGELFNQRGVDWFGEPGVGDSRRKAACRKLVGGFQRVTQPGPKRKYRDTVSIAHHPALTELQDLALSWHHDAGAFAARITERAWPIVNGDSGRDHVHQ